MNISKAIYFVDRKDWRQWLKKNHKKAREIWLIYYKAASGKPRIPYNDAVEEALCFGWIDSTVKGIDDEKFAQRFTPRNPKSHASEPNKERIRKLIKQRKMTKDGLHAVRNSFNAQEKIKLVIAKDILNAIKSNKAIWENFKKFPECYKRIRILYIENRITHSKEMFEKSLAYFIKMTSKNKKFGMLR